MKRRPMRARMIRRICRLSRTLTGLHGVSAVVGGGCRSSTRLSGRALQVFDRCCTVLMTMKRCVSVPISSKRQVWRLHYRRCQERATVMMAAIARTIWQAVLMCSMVMAVPLLMRL